MKIGAMVLGIIASFIALPASLFSAMFIEVFAQPADGPVADAFVATGLVSAVTAFASSIVVMVSARWGTSGLLFSSLLALFTCASLNPGAWLETVLLGVATALGFAVVRHDQQATLAQQPPRGYVGHGFVPAQPPSAPARPPWA